MKKGRRGHPCQPDTSQLGVWRCDVCGQDWEIHGIAGNDVRVRKVSRVGWFIVKLFG